MNNESINLLINEEIKYSDFLASKYNYPDNITHLLYLIIPAFIIKYNNKLLIEKCFMDVPIVISDKQDKIYQAYYHSSPSYIDSKYVSKKGIVLNNYSDISLIQLLDNLVHEYNHAVNSINNEIVVDKYVGIRTGISFNYFDKQSLKFIKKSNNVILEEVSNTKQTETLINIINSFKDYDINDVVVSNTLYSINSNTNGKYKSNSYYLESVVCMKILENKTFLSTFEKLRFQGYVLELFNFFDTVTGINGSFNELSRLLEEIFEQQINLQKIKFFKKYKINKIKKITEKALMIVDTFNKNSIYK